MATPFLPAAMKNSTKASMSSRRHVGLLAADARPARGVGSAASLRRSSAIGAAADAASSLRGLVVRTSSACAVVFTTTGNRDVLDLAVRGERASGIRLT